MRRPTKDELNQLEVRAARVAMEAFMLTLRDGLKKYGPEGETGAVLEFFGETLHQHNCFVTGSKPGTLTFTFQFDPKPETGRASMGALRKIAAPIQCKVGPVLQMLMMNDCPDSAVVVCVDARENQWTACGRPEHQKGAVKKEPIADWLEREGWLGGGSVR